MLFLVLKQTALLLLFLKTLNSSFKVEMLRFYFNFLWGLLSLMLAIRTKYECYQRPACFGEQPRQHTAYPSSGNTGCHQLGLLMSPAGCHIRKRLCRAARQVPGAGAALLWGSPGLRRGDSNAHLIPPWCQAEDRPPACMLPATTATKPAVWGGAGDLL